MYVCNFQISSQYKNKYQSQYNKVLKKVPHIAQVISSLQWEWKTVPQFSLQYKINTRASTTKYHKFTKYSQDYNENEKLFPFKFLCNRKNISKSLQQSIKRSTANFPIIWSLQWDWKIVPFQVSSQYKISTRASTTKYHKFTKYTQD